MVTYIYKEHRRKRESIYYIVYMVRLNVRAQHVMGRDWIGYVKLEHGLGVENVQNVCCMLYVFYRRFIVHSTV